MSRVFAGVLVVLAISPFGGAEESEGTIVAECLLQSPPDIKRHQKQHDDDGDIVAFANDLP